MSAAWTILVTLAALVRLLWLWPSFFLSVARDLGRTLPEPADGLCRFLASELRPFYLPAVGVYIANLATHGQMLGWNSLWAALSLVCWFIYKDEGDDRWKRRKAKLAEKVERRGARLVAVPVPAGGGR